MEEEEGRAHNQGDAARRLRADRRAADDGRQRIIFPGRAEEMNEIAFKAVVLEGFGEITWSLLLRSFKKIIDYLIVLNKTNIEVRFYYH